MSTDVETKESLEIQRMFREQGLCIARDYLNGTMEYEVVVIPTVGNTEIQIVGKLGKQYTKEDCIKFLEDYKRKTDALIHFHK